MIGLFKKPSDKLKPFALKMVRFFYCRKILAILSTNTVLILKAKSNYIEISKNTKHRDQ